MKMAKKKGYVDYLEIVARNDEENQEERRQKAEKAESVVLPEQAGKKSADYLAVSQAWKAVRGVTEDEGYPG